MIDKIKLLKTITWTTPRECFIYLLYIIFFVFITTCILYGVDKVTFEVLRYLMKFIIGIRG